MKSFCVICGEYGEDHQCDADYTDPEPKYPSEGERLYEGLLIMFGE